MLKQEDAALREVERKTQEARAHAPKVYVEAPQVSAERSREKSERIPQAEAAIQGQFSIYTRGHELRLKQSNGDLNVYLGKSDFQSIAFPD
jgi:hypothetical protein